ncbi:MAG: hypothetical protein M3Y33_11850, partial [Actinomycetota bacterium]|nr:hypothetical protein [Actinomycetota bacterium]
MQALVQGAPDLDKRVRKISTSHGDEGIELHPLPTLIMGSDARMVRRASTPPRLRFLARSRTSARGFSCDLLVYDEAMVLSADTVESSMPTMTAMPNPQIWYTASEGRADAHHLARVRRRGIAGQSRRLMYAEWSAELCHEMCPARCAVHDNPDSPRTWAKANPAYGIRIRGEFLDDVHDAMAPESFATSHLGVSEWPADAEGWAVISEPAWDACADPDSDRPPPRGIAIAVDASEDGASAAIAIAGLRKDRKTVGEIPHGDHRPGTAWVPARLAELAAKYRPCAIVIDPRGPAGHLIDACSKLTPALEITEPSSTEMAQAYGLFIV